ncbi:tubulin-tyrosine ligase family-domain-containing protein [Pelagophyceae sp. CCMP2097]|nr:tubulin-tyrosine ligase family-domain-containing protein [Pelagophyceae sp. CCMP2097]
MRGSSARRSLPSNPASDDSDDDGGAAVAPARPRPDGNEAVRRSRPEGNEAVYGGRPWALHFRVNSSRPEVFDIVTHVLSGDSDWVELPAGLGLKTTWNLLWTWSRPRVNYDHLLSWQRVNHYPGARHLTRKDLLARALLKMQKMVKGGRFQGEFDVCPTTFLLPQDYPALVSEFHRVKAVSLESGETNLWIMKPCGLSRGRGISVVASLDDVTYSDPVVVQRYIPRPMLLRGHKFDLRLYVLVTSFQPLEAFVYTEGFARVATKKFNDNAEGCDDKFVHLTNASIQKHGSYEDSGNSGPFAGASANEAAQTKCTLDFLWKVLTAEDSTLDVSAVWSSICNLIVKSLVAAEDEVPHQPNSFEVFGYDVLIDEDRRPWLIEVNASPSMARETPLDARIKESMIRDTVRLIAPIAFDRDELVRVFDRRLRDLEAVARPPAQKRRNAAAKDDDPTHADLEGVLHHSERPRKYGEPPARMGGYETLAPSPLYDRIRKIKRSVCKERDPV